MKNICFFTKSWRSGAGWFAQELVQALAEVGSNVEFVAPKAEPVLREPIHPRVKRSQVPRELPESDPLLRRVIASSLRTVASLIAILGARRRCRTFVASIPEPLLFTLPVFFALRLTGARLIYIVHDAVPHAWKLKGPLSHVERAAHALSYRLATVLVTLSETGKADLCNKFGIASDKIKVIPHGAYGIAKLPPIPGNRSLLLFGTLRRNKCVLETIQAVQKLRNAGNDIRLLIAGAPYRNDRKYWEECSALIEADPKGIEVHPRFVDDDELIELFGRTDGVLLAYSGFSSQSGVAVLAACSGRPLIATQSGGLSELFRAGVAHEKIMSPVTGDTIADAIEQFYLRPIAQWEETASAAREKIMDYLSWRRIARAYVDLAA